MEQKSEQAALWPDDPAVRHYECWNCGRLARHSVKGSATRLMCECGCGWSVRFGVVPAVERSMLEFKEVNLARQLGRELVDFTKAGAPSAPA